MIRLRFVYNGDLSSQAIRLFSRGWPSHVDAVLHDGHLLGARSDLCGGQPRGVQIRPSYYDPGTKHEFVNLPTNSKVQSLFYDFVRAQVGKPYDWRAILAFAFDRDWRNTDAWFCSELIASGLETAGFFRRPLPTQSNKITPRDLLLLTAPWAIA
jgi:hypothetical protein